MIMLAVAYLWVSFFVCKFIEICKKPIPTMETTMAGYGVKEARISRERRPDAAVCGGCGAECNTLLCEECRGTLGPNEEDEGEEARRTR